MPISSGYKTWSEWLVLALGILILLFSLFFIVGGFILASYGGSIYYVICGVALLLAAIFTILGRPLGAVLYLLALAGTWVWSLWEVGLDPVGLLPRDFGPTLIGILYVVLIPVLRRMDERRTMKGAV